MLQAIIQAFPGPNFVSSSSGDTELVEFHRVPRGSGKRLQLFCRRGLGIFRHVCSWYPHQDCNIGGLEDNADKAMDNFRA